jgi:hypothetical protein
MEKYSALLPWVWMGLGLIGEIILRRNPDKLVFERTFWGSMFRTGLLTFILMCSVFGGPITLVVAILLPKKQLCPHCYKVNLKEALVCIRCNWPITSLIPAETSKPIYLRPQFSPEVEFAIIAGKRMVNIPILFIMLGIWITGLLLGAFAKFTIAIVISLPLGFVLGWLWWSYKIPRWRAWALQQPGVTPEALQSAAEIAMLVWPKGHCFEKTEFKVKE